MLIMENFGGIKMDDIFLKPSGNEKTIEVKSPEIVNIIRKDGETKLDLSLFRKKSNAKNFSGFIIGKMKEAKKVENLETALFLQEIYKKYKEFQTSEKLFLERWRGKSGITLIENPDRFICITYKKADKGEIPKENRKEILKEDLNKLILILNKFENKDKIPTADIAEKFYGKSWQSYVYGHRGCHISLVYMLNILEQKGYTSYSRKGFTKVLNQMKLF